MPIKRSVLAEREIRSARLDFGEGGDLNWTYYPGKISVGLMRRMNSIGEDTDDAETEAIISEMADVIASWDYLDDDGNVFDVNPEAFSDIPLDVMVAMFSAMSGQGLPKSPTSTSSNGRSKTRTSTKSK